MWQKLCSLLRQLMLKAVAAAFQAGSLAGFGMGAEANHPPDFFRANRSFQLNMTIAWLLLLLLFIALHLAAPPDHVGFEVCWRVFLRQ